MNIMLRRVTCSNCSVFRAMNAPADVRDEAVTETSFKVLSIKLAIISLSGRGRVDFDFSMFLERSITVVVFALLVLEVNLPSGVMPGMLVGAIMDVVPDICTDISAGVDANTRVAVITVLDFICMLASSDEALLLGRKGRS